MILKKICIYASSSNNIPAEYARCCQSIAELLARRDMELIYGGGDIGIMGKVAQIFLNHNRPVTGVIPEKLNIPGVVHRGLTQLIIVPDMRKRKELMENLADGFIAFPGGIGTMEELLEIMTLKQLGYHSKPIILYNCLDYYTPLVRMLEKTVQLGFMKSEFMDFISISSDDHQIIDYLETYQAPSSIRKWV
ncbi:MAG: TIGR00730 family Rossman fold protein [Candidatus Delongbacteria bacterium]|nr:TIGR00730 family Rossman fold protein [Candidatus Delongbacteria bacterium]